MSLRTYKKRHVPTLEDAFNSRVNKTKTCWLWTGVVNLDGYSRLYTGNNKYVMGHRFSYEKINGKIPKHLEIDHLCRVRNCVNPEHLEAVTHKENVNRGGNTKKTHCIHGHEFSDKNTRINKKTNARICLTCRDKVGKYHREKNREKNREYQIEYRRKNAKNNDT